MRRVKVNLLSSGRFHILDLARELDKNGFDVMFYSFVPTWRAKKFGLREGCSFSLFWILGPFVYAERKLGKKITFLKWWRNRFQDWLTSKVMRKADITIALSGSFVISAKTAKKREDIVIIDRGSKHILEQKRILESIPALFSHTPIPDSNINRELDCYEIADYIFVPALHVERSFLIHGFPKEKLFLNNFGVDVSMFYEDKNVKKQYDLIMVGNWSYRKGCDLIIGAVKKMNLQFLHVGNIGDIDFPDDKNFTHVNAVDESKLVKYYNQAKIFVLPSREEGLSLVQVQAIACNLPIIGSPDSGAEDLRNLVEMQNYISLIKDYTVDSLVNEINNMMILYDSLDGKRYTGNSLQAISWSEYGKRCSRFLQSII